jgi:hypothetical protein
VPTPVPAPAVPRHGVRRGALNPRDYPDDPIGEIRLSNVDFQHTSQPSVVENVASLVLDRVLENGEPMSG